MEDKPKSNGRLAVLQTLAGSPDKLVQLATLAMIAVSGMLNVFETRESSHENRDLFKKQTREIWQALDRNKDDFRRLVDDSAASRKILTERVDNQIQLLKNQQEMLHNQQLGLAILQEGQRQFLLRQQRLFPQPPSASP